MTSTLNSTSINMPLVESLIQAIHALSPAEQILVRSRLLASPTGTSRKSAIDLLNQSPPPQLFQTPQEVDLYLQKERSAWDN